MILELPPEQHHLVPLRQKKTKSVQFAETKLLDTILMLLHVKAVKHFFEEMPLNQR